MSITIPNPPGLPNTPGATSLELAAQRRTTKAFIDRLPTTLILTPRSRVRKPAGGWVWEDQADRLPQVFTLIEHSGPPEMVRAQDGVDRRVEFELLGEWDSQMAVGDVFSHKGKDWEIVEMWFENDYERRARVTARG